MRRLLYEELKDKLNTTNKYFEQFILNSIFNHIMILYILRFSNFYFALYKFLLANISKYLLSFFLIICTIQYFTFLCGGHLVHNINIYI